MKLYFLTKDANLDYPRVGWQPEMPDRSLWEQFGNLHAGEYPELILSVKDNQWQLYLSAIDSGRRDYTNTVIRISLVMSGTLDDRHGVPELIDVFLRQVLTGQDDKKTLTGFLSGLIMPGEPAKYAELSPEGKSAVSEKIMAALLTFPPGESVCPSHGRWYAGVNAAGALTEFSAFCRNLLCSGISGTALALVNLSREDLPRALTACGNPERAAILLTTPEDARLPLQTLPEVKKKPCLAAPSQSRRRRDGNGKWYILGALGGIGAIFWWLGGLLLLLGVAAIAVGLMVVAMRKYKK